MLYRYEFAHNNRGMLTELDELFGEDKAWELSFYFDIHLERPVADLKETISFFTEKGNRKFSKAIRKIKNYASEKGYEVIRIEKEEKELDILYKDEYQVLALRY